MLQTASRLAPIKIDQGHALLHLAKMYPTLLEVIFELVQNSLDKDVAATKVDIAVNFRTRHLSVRDNGNGSSPKRFQLALESVATPGRKGEGSLGQFGIGLVSPLGKCEQFTFTSCPAPLKEEFIEWKFVTDEVIAQKENLTIPWRPRPDLTLMESLSRGKTKVTWRSEMLLSKFTTDSYESRIPIDALASGIQERYATTMRRNKVVVSISITDKNGQVESRPNVTAPQFRGQPLPEQTFQSVDAGKTTFRLFVSPMRLKGRTGKVLMGVMGNDFRFPFHYFARAATDLIKDEVIAALSSGLFEGEILSEKALLHPSRKTFEKNDSFVGLCCHIEEWFDSYGSKHLNELRQSRQEQRLQELGLRSMKVIEYLLKDPIHQCLLDVIKSFHKGNIGTGHVIPPEKKIVGKQEQPSLSLDGKPGVPRKEDADEPPTSRDQPTREKKAHVPLSVAGPKGKLRTLVKSSSLGLQFAHEAMEGSNDLWRLDTEEGILIFNSRHPLWIACDVKDTTLMKLQECVAMEALTLYMMPEHLRAHQRQVLDEFNHSFVSWILNSDKARSLGRSQGPGNEKAK